MDHRFSDLEIRGETTKPTLAQMWKGLLDRGLVELIDCYPGDRTFLVVKPQDPELNDWGFFV